MIDGIQEAQSAGAVVAVVVVDQLGASDDGRRLSGRLQRVWNVPGRKAKRMSRKKKMVVVWEACGEFRDGDGGGVGGVVVVFGDMVFFLSFLSKSRLSPAWRLMRAVLEGTSFVGPLQTVPTAALARVVGEAFESSTGAGVVTNAWPRLGSNRPWTPPTTCLILIAYSLLGTDLFPNPFCYKPWPREHNNTGTRHLVTLP